MLKPSTTIALLCALPAAAEAQPALDRVADAYAVYRYSFDDDPTLSSDFGFVMGALSDLNGDGAFELVIDRARSSHLRIIDPANGALLDTIGVPTQSPDPSAEHWTLRGTVADLNGDGLRDILGVRAADTLVAISGAPPWSILWTRASQIGAITDPGDLNDDGVPDIVCFGSVPLADGGFASPVLALSGVDGSVLWSNSVGGYRRMTPLPDVTGDGAAEIAVGGNSLVRILDGASGAQLREILPIFNSWDFGLSFATIPDVNDDGIDDLAIAMPRQNFGPWQKRAVIVHSPVDGAPLELIYSHEWNSTTFGYGIVRVGDMNGDGIDEIVINDQTPPEQYVEPRGSLIIYDGATRDMLWVIDNKAGGLPDEGLNLGASVVDVGDIDGDGAADFAADMRLFDQVQTFNKPGTPTLYVYAPASVCFSDLNADGMIDAADLASLLSNWGADPHDYDFGTGRNALTGNIDMSRNVDGGDLAFLLAHWGVCD